MGITLAMVNGQIDLSNATGQINTVTGNRKAAQDLGESLLQDYYAGNASGSYLRALAQNPVPGAGDLFVRYYISDAVRRLQALQQQDPNLDAAEQITAIIALDVESDDDATDVFFVGVSTADGGTSVVGAVQPTQLNQQFEEI